MFKQFFVILFMFHLPFLFAAGNDIDSFQKSQGKNATCTNENPVKTLILIDKTDPLTDAQKAFIKSSYVDNYDWENDGDTFGIAILNGSGVALMKTETVCAPRPLSVNNGIANRNKVKRFKEVLQDLFDNFIGDEPEAKNSNLFEAIVEVYRNPTFKFSPSNRGRNLIIVSDLYQNSSNINFYKKCKNGCPSFEDSLRADQDMKNYLDLANLKLTEKDSIKIYHLQSKCRIAKSIDKWWSGAFRNAGLRETNLIIDHELAGDCPAPV